MRIIKSFLFYAIGLSITGMAMFRLMDELPSTEIQSVANGEQLTVTQLLSKYHSKSVNLNFQNSQRKLEESEHTNESNEGNTDSGESETEEETEHNSEEESSVSSHSGHEMGSGSKIIFFVIMALLIGCVLKEIKKKTNIPMTPMILIIGLLMGFYSNNLYLLGDCTQLINSINPHTLLTIFIPGLVFEGAYNTDAYVMRKSKWQVLIMAGPGVLITSFILAWAFTDLFSYTSISFSEALIIGSIISTTDPVSVVALLKELGASTRFKTILEGESLLNDGTAYVFFLVCLDVVVNGGINWLDAGIKFIRLSFGGPLFGAIVGFLVSKWVGRIRKDSGLISVISVVACYIVFFYSENYLEVSGILALVSLGVYLSGFMKVNLSHEIDHTVHTVWGFCGFSLETLIFLISGTYIGAKFHEYQDLTLTTTDIWKALIFYPFLTLVRYLVTLIQLPVLNKVGYKITGTSALILSYGGLRGAIALSLGMLVAVDSRLNQHFRDVCLFYVVTTIVFTVCVNGLTIKLLMKVSGFLKKDPIKEKMKHGILRKMLVNTLKEKINVKEEDDLCYANWDQVEHLSKLRQYKVLERLAYKTNQSHPLDTEIINLSMGDESERGSIDDTQGKNNDARKNTKETKLQKLRHHLHHNGLDISGASEDIHKLVEDPFHNIRSEDIKKELRARIYKLLKHNAQLKMDHNECRPDIVRCLKFLCDMCNDEIDHPICIRHLSDTFIVDHDTIKFF